MAVDPATTTLDPVTEHEDLFRERGISLAVVRARPYVRSTYEGVRERLAELTAE